LLEKTSICSLAKTHFFFSNDSAASAKAYSAVKVAEVNSTRRPVAFPLEASWL
jgi:hypothetical protein